MRFRPIHSTENLGFGLMIQPRTFGVSEFSVQVVCGPKVFGGADFDRKVGPRRMISVLPLISVPIVSQLVFSIFGLEFDSKYRKLL